MKGMVAPIIAGKASERASRALTGDIYVREWTSTVGKGKKKKEIHHQVRVNAVTAAVVAVGAALTLGLGAAALWITQKKVSRKRTVDGDYGYDLVLIVEQYETTYKTVTTDITTYYQVIRGVPTVISKETYDSLLGTGAILYEDTKSVGEQVVDKPGYFIVKSKRGVPYGKHEGVPEGENVLTKYQKSKQYFYVRELKCESIWKGEEWLGNRRWWLFHTNQKQTYQIGDRKGFLE